MFSPPIETVSTDVAVVGAGVAGLRAALEAARYGTVRIFAKDRLQDSNTHFAQGGIAAALSDEDRTTLHLEDTLRAGAGLSDPDCARILVEEGVQRVQELIRWGAAFDRQGSRLVFGLEGAHSRRRILHAGGDATGSEIVRILLKKAGQHANIRFIDRCFTLSLILEDGVCRGLWMWDATHERCVQVRSHAVILATGGAGRVYPYTTNPPFATGDGIGIAFRANLELTDMEFFQFHPTALHLPGQPNFLLSEALRGEGAHIVDETGRRILAETHPQAELAPRDIVSQALYRALRNGHRVFLDTRHLNAAQLQRRFPRIATMLRRYGLELGRDLIPVTPAAHYIMGGIRTDAWGQTGVPGLYAAGEVACNGVHGANRLASNSLLEGLVFGARAGQAAGQAPRTRFPTVVPAPAFETGPLPSVPLQETAWESIGIIRDESGLRRAITQYSAWLRDHTSLTPHRPAAERAHMLMVAWSIAAFACLRQESRGAHLRSDYPNPNPDGCRHQVWRPADLWAEIEKRTGLELGPFPFRGGK